MKRVQMRKEESEEEKQKRQEKILKEKVNIKYNKIKEDLPYPFHLDDFKLQKLKNCKNDKCSICLENFVIGNQCLYMPCLHLFHSMCIMHWLLDNDNCPECKLNYKNEENDDNNLIRNLRISIMPEINSDSNSNSNNNSDSDNDFDNNQNRHNFNYFNRGRGGYWRGRGPIFNRGRGNIRGRGRGGFIRSRGRGSFNTRGNGRGNYNIGGRGNYNRGQNSFLRGNNHRRGYQRGNQRGNQRGVQRRIQGGRGRGNRRVFQRGLGRGNWNNNFHERESYRRRDNFSNSDGEWSNEREESEENS